MESNNTISSIEEATAFIISKITSLVEISEYEQAIIHQALLIPYSSVTNAKSVLSDKIDEATRCKADLNYIILRLQDKKKIIQIPYDEEYNKQYTLLSRANRPSKQAIDSEMRYKDKKLFDTFNLLNDFTTIIEYLTTVHTILDIFIRNMENRRYNL